MTLYSQAQSWLYEIRQNRIPHERFSPFGCISKFRHNFCVSVIHHSLLSLLLSFHLNNVLSPSNKNTVSKKAFGSLWESKASSFICLSWPCSSPIACPPFPHPPEFLPPLLLFLHPFSLSRSHLLSIFRSFPPTNYLQDYRFSVGCDWVSLGVMWALRCLLNGEHHELWTNDSHSSTTPESQTHTVFTNTHTEKLHSPRHTTCVHQGYLHQSYLHLLKYRHKHRTNLMWLSTELNWHFVFVIFIALHVYQYYPQTNLQINRWMRSSPLSHFRLIYVNSFSYHSRPFFEPPLNALSWAMVARSANLQGGKLLFSASPSVLHRFINFVSRHKWQMLTLKCL